MKVEYGVFYAGPVVSRASFECPVRHEFDPPTGVLRIFGVVSGIEREVAYYSGVVAYQRAEG